MRHSPQQNVYTYEELCIKLPYIRSIAQQLTAVREAIKESARDMLFYGGPDKQDDSVQAIRALQTRRKEEERRCLDELLAMGILFCEQIDRLMIPVRINNNPAAYLYNPLTHTVEEYAFLSTMPRAYSISDDSVCDLRKTLLPCPQPQQKSEH